MTFEPNNFWAILIRILSSNQSTTGPYNPGSTVTITMALKETQASFHSNLLSESHALIASH